VVLVVDDDETDQKIFANPFTRWRVEVVGTLRDALQAIEKIDDLWLAMLDVRLPDTRGDDLFGPNQSVFGLVETLRSRWPHAIVVIMSGSAAWTTFVNPAQAVQAEFFSKFDFDLNVRKLVDRLDRRELAGSDSNWNALERLRASHKLTASELRVAACALRGMDRAEMAENLGVSENTVKSQVRSILTKTGATHLRELARPPARTLATAKPRSRR